MKNKILGILVVLMMFAVFTPVVKAVTIDDLMTQIKLLQKQISDLKVQVKAEVLDAVESITKTTTPAKSTVTVPVKTVVPTTTKTTLTPTSSTPADDSISNTSLPQGDSKITIPVTSQTPEPKKATIVTASISSTGWQNVGTSGFSNDTAFRESIAFDTNNTPYMAFLNGYGGGSNNLEATVMKWSGNNWTSVGDPNGISLADAVSNLVIGSDNIPYLAYGDTSVGIPFQPNERATVVKWNGTAWVPVGIPRFSQGPIAYFPSLILDSSNTPYLAYVEIVNGINKLTVMKFNSTTWVPVGDPVVSGGIIQYTSLAIDSNNVPYVAYIDANNGKATVMKFNGTTWVPVGAQGFSAGGILFPSLALDASNIPYVAYVDVANNDKATVMKFNGTAWVPVGAQGFSTGNINNYGDQIISLKFDKYNIPNVAYSDGSVGYKAIVMKFNGSTCVPVGTPGFSMGETRWTYLAFNSNNIPYVAFMDLANDFKATVMKYPVIVIPNSLTITYPNGGETFSAGNQFTAKWNSTGFLTTDNLSFDLQKVGGSSGYGVNLTTSTPNDGTQTFTIPPNTLPGQYKLCGQFLNTTITDCSDNNFTIQGIWTNLGTPGFSTGDTEYVSSALDSANNLYVAYKDFANSQKLTVKKWDGTTWTTIGTQGFSINPVDYVSLKVDSFDHPYVAFREYKANSWKASVMKWDGTSWSYVGLSEFSAGQANYISLALNSNNVPYVLYQDIAYGQKATLKYFNGTSWANVGSQGFTPGPANGISLAINSNDVPYVLYSNALNSNRINVMKFYNNSWQYVGNTGIHTSGNTGVEFYSSIDFDSNDQPYILFSDPTSASIVMKLNGTSWTYVGGLGIVASGPNVPDFRHLSLKIGQDDSPYVAFTDFSKNKKATVKRFNGTNWGYVGTPGFSAGEVKYTQLNIGSNNTLDVSYQDSFYNKKATVMKFEQ